MHVLVAYASHFGATKGIAERIADTLSESGLEVDLSAADVLRDAPGDGRFDAYVLGSAVHGGHWLPAARDFACTNPAFSDRPVWLFSSGPIGDRYVGLQQPEPKEVEEIRQRLNVRDHVVFAGAFDRSTADFSGFGWLDRNVARRFLPEGDVRDWTAIQSWAGKIAQELGRVTAVAAGRKEV